MTIPPKNHLRTKIFALTIAAAEAFASVVHASAPIAAHDQTQLRTFNDHASEQAHSKHMPGGYKAPTKTSHTHSTSGHSPGGHETPHKDGGHGGGDNEHVPHRDRRERDNRRGELHFETPPRRSQYGEYLLDPVA